MISYTNLVKCRSCGPSSGSYGPTDLSRNRLVEYFSTNAAYQEAALVWEAFDQILPKFAEVRDQVTTLELLSVLCSYHKCANDLYIHCRK